MGQRVRDRAKDRGLDNGKVMGQWGIEQQGGRGREGKGQGRGKEIGHWVDDGAMRS